MADFHDFLAELKKGLGDFVDSSWKDFQQAALDDGDAFVTKMASDLERWTALLAQGSLTTQDFEFLVAAKKDLAEMTALKRLGLAQVQLDRFINGVIDLVMHTAITVFL
jgi:hypothetical protein